MTKMIHQIGFGTARELFPSKYGNLETEVENKLLLVKLTKPKTQTRGRPTCLSFRYCRLYIFFLFIAFFAHLSTRGPAVSAAIRVSVPTT